MNKILLLTLLFAALLSMSSAALWCKACKKYEDGHCTTGETNCQGPSRVITCLRITYSNGTGHTKCVFNGLCEHYEKENKDPNKRFLCCKTNFCNKMQPWTSPTSTPSDSSPTESP